MKSSTPFENEPRERSARMKRAPSASLAMNMSSSRSSGSTSLTKAPCEFTTGYCCFTKADSYTLASLSSASASKITITYPNGALRITRTPGRQKTKNCVNLEDVIHKQHLISACVFSFFIGDRELYDHLPLSHSSDAVPVSASHTPPSSIRMT